MKYILKLVAEQNGVSPEEVRTEIAAAIQAGMESADVSARRQWAQIPKEHAVPTPEEVITYLAARTVRTSVLCPVSSGHAYPMA